MSTASSYIYMVIYIFATVSIARCDNENFYDNSMTDDEMVDPHSIYFDRMDEVISELDLPMNEGELVDPHSLYFDHRNKRMTKETNSQLLKLAHMNHGGCSGQSRSIKNNAYSLQELIFYKRLINLILSNISVQRESDDLIVGTLRIEMSHSQMEALKNFQIGKKSLREIDAIVSDVIKEPKFNYVSVVTHLYDRLVRIVEIIFNMMLQYSQTTIIILTLIVSYIALKRIRWQRGIPIFFLMQLIIVMSFFMTWWQLIQEAEIKFTATQMKYSEIPIACQPDKMNMWHKFVAFISSNDDCEKYYEAMMSNPKLKVTPAVALSHFISTAVLHPAANIGTAVSTFIKNATDDLPWIYAWAVKLVLYLSVGMGIIMLPFTLFGTSIKMALGPLFKLGINCQEKNIKGNIIQDSTKREPVQIILQQLPHNTGALVTNNVLKVDEAKAIQTVPDTDHGKEVFDGKHNFQESTEDWSSGDAAISTLTCTDNTRLSSDEKCDLINGKPEDGSGDC